MPRKSPARTMPPRTEEHRELVRLRQAYKNLDDDNTRLTQENLSMEQTIKYHNNIRFALYDGLVAEHHELESRQIRITMRIRGLSLTPPWEEPTNA